MKHHQWNISQKIDVSPFYILILVLTAFQFSAYGQSENNDPASADKSSEVQQAIQVTGKVIDAESKTQIPDAVVKDLITYTTTKTNAGGYFQLSMDTTHRLIISKPGYVTLEAKVKSSRVLIPLYKTPASDVTLDKDDVTTLITAIVHGIRYPMNARDKEIQGRVYVSFTVDSLGKIQNAVVIKDIGYTCGQSVLDQLATMPSLKPSRASRQFILPVTFLLENKRVKLPPVGSDIEQMTSPMLNEVVIVGYGQIKRRDY